MSFTTKVLLIFLLVTLYFPAYGDTSIPQSQITAVSDRLFKKSTRFLGTHMPDDSSPGFNRSFSFSHDNKLFALFQLYEEELGTIRVWDIQSKKLKYKTIISDYSDAAGGSYAVLQFSPNDQLITISGIVGSPLITWKFKESNKIEKSCQGYMGGGILEISDDNKYYTTATSDNQFSLCQPGIEGELLNYKTWMPERWWGANTQVLHNNKLLTIYNYRLESESPNRSKEQPAESVLRQVELWDINFTSKADRLIKHLDRKNLRFMLIESFRNKSIINQWDYAKRQFISKTKLNGVQASNIYVSDNHVLMRHQNKFSLLYRIKNGLKLLWSKDLSDIYSGLDKMRPLEDGQRFDPYSIKFSLDGKHIIFYSDEFYGSGDGEPFSPVILVATDNGAIQSYPPIRTNSSISVDPKGEYFFEEQYRCKQNKTTLYGLVVNTESTNEVKGGVMDVSPDGNVLAICDGNELLFLDNSRH